VSVTDIPRTVVDSYLRLVRVPIDAAINRLAGNETGPAPRVRLVVDRADASIRAVLASILRDPRLRDDADQRRTATEKREHALQLREVAERQTERADSRLGSAKLRPRASANRPSNAL
jgi:hypothetical protein